MAIYRIKPGHSFRMPDGSVKTAPAEIELDSDVAATHAAALEPAPETPAADTAAHQE